MCVLPLLPVEDGKGWPQGGSQAQTAEGVICRALQEPLFGLKAPVIRAALLCSLEIPLGAPAAPTIWGLEESRLRYTLAVQQLIKTLGKVAGGPLSP